MRVVGSHVLTTLVCMFLTPNSARLVVEGLFLKVAVVTAAIDRPALERSVRRRLEENSLAVWGEQVLKKREGEEGEGQLRRMGRKRENCMPKRFATVRLVNAIVGRACSKRKSKGSVVKAKWKLCSGLQCLAAILYGATRCNYCSHTKVGN